MVFAGLQTHEKDAFFSLLDEYFSSRSDIFGQVGAGGGSKGASSPGDAVHRALASNPEATAKLVSAGLKHGVPKSSPYSAAASNPEVNNAFGRVAAASLSFGQRDNNPPPPRRPFGGGSASPPGNDSAPDTSSVSLASARAKFSEVDTSSPKNMFTSLRSSNSPSPAASPAPSSFAHKSAFSAPPRRVADSGPPAPPRRAQPPPEPEPEEEEPEEEAQGEWAEALYDYESKDPGDLEIQEGQRVLVTEKTSDDWWTGEVNGKSGLFPAAYVKVL